MPFAAALHLIVAFFFAVHAVRNRQPMYWLFILISMPLFGSLVYFFAVYLPQSRLENGARKAIAATVKVFDPERDLREAKFEFETAPTAQNQIRLAEALLEAGEAEAAAQNFEACLKGPFATDATMRFGAARAFVECERYQEAIKYLEDIRKDNPEFKKQEMVLILGRAYAGAHRNAEAEALFDEGYSQFGGFGITAEYAIFLAAIGNAGKAEQLRQEADLIMKRWPKHAKRFNAPIVRRLNTTFSKK